MRINYGKYVLTSTRDVEIALADQKKQITIKNNQLDAIREWATNSLAQHIPYFSGRIDLSTSNPENRKKNLVSQIDRNLFCAECQISWPCKQIEELKLIKNIAHGYMSDDAVMEAQEEFSKIKPKNIIGEFWGKEFFL